MISTPKESACYSGFIVSRCEGGFVVRPVNKLDNRRWYFDSRQEAHEWIEYMYRRELQS